MKKEGPKQKEGSTYSSWQFRREITLGTLVHILAIAIALITGWSNLQRELGLIRQELNQLNQSKIHWDKSLKESQAISSDHEYRIRRLEEKKDIDNQYPSYVFHTVKGDHNETY